MAIITWGPLIEYMSGRMGDTVFIKLRNINYTRALPKKNNPNTVLQKSNRSMFSTAVSSWQALAAEEKETYIKRAVKLNMSGYNLYISEYMKAGISVKKHTKSGKPSAEIVRPHYGHGRFSLGSPLLLLRICFASSSISPLISRLSEPKSAAYGVNGGRCPP